MLCIRCFKNTWAQATDIEVRPDSGFTDSKISGFWDLRIPGFFEGPEVSLPQSRSKFIWHQWVNILRFEELLCIPTVFYISSWQIQRVYTFTITMHRLRAQMFPTNQTFYRHVFPQAAFHGLSQQTRYVLMAVDQILSNSWRLVKILFLRGILVPHSLSWDVERIRRKL